MGQGTQNRTDVTLSNSDSLLFGLEGTIGLEILEQVDHVDMVIIPVGGGGLIAGIAKSVKTLHPEVRQYNSFVYGFHPTDIACEAPPILGVPLQISHSIHRWRP